ncbi:MAG TPA: DHA2 family efflux MFS transporter permease subunit [Chloroflexota bacterium]|nr:DHA2 family efflux MFS transporter permease subunit [Chloroflexota bacterium]
MGTVGSLVVGRRPIFQIGMAYHWQALVAVVLGTFVVVLNQTIVNVALPRVIQIFQATVDQGQLVLTTYMLALAVFMPATGFLTDRLGTKRAYLGSVGLFTIFTALCGLAPTMDVLILFRVLQGIGGAMVMPLGMAIIFQTAPPRERGAVMGMFGLPVLVAPMSGPVLGGYLVDAVGWRPIFLIGMPVGIAAVLYGMAILRETPRKHDTRFDWAGFILGGVGFSAALAALSRAPADGWFAPHLVALWLVAAAALGCWVVIELTDKHPLLDLGVLKDRTYLTSNVVVCLIMVLMFGSQLLVPLFLQNVRGLSPFATGLLMAPEAIAMAIMMPIAGRLLDKVGPRPLAIPGLIGLSFAYWQLSGLDPNTSDTTIAAILVLRGVSQGIMILPLMTVGMDRIAAARMSRATVLATVIRQIAGAFGAAAAASLLLTRQQHHQATLVQTVTPDAPAVVSSLGSITVRLLEQGATAANSANMALGYLNDRTKEVASVRAYDDCFLVYAVLALMTLAPVLMVPRRRQHH